MQTDLAQLVPRLTDYFGIWAMHEPILKATVDRVNSMDLVAHVQQQTSQARAGDSDGSYGFSLRDDGIAVVDIMGTLMKGETSLSQSTSTVKMRKTLRSLGSNDAVKAVMIRIDSPGGTVSGTQDLADEVAALASIKPTHAYIEDLGASAAYWIASQTHSISANRTAMVGSIGTYAVINDFSALAAKEGIKVHVVRAGEFKGSGTPGTEITDKQLAEWQRLVNEHNEHFLEAVHRGRGPMTMADVRSIADGRVHLAEDAKKLGIIDSVVSFDAAIKQLSVAAQITTGEQRPPRPISAATTTETHTMADELTKAPVAEPPKPVVTDAEPKETPPAPRATFLAELNRFRTAFGDANGAKWFGEGKSFEDALGLECADLKTQLKARDEKIGKLEQKLSAIQRGLPEPISFSEAPTEGKDRVAELQAALRAEEDPKKRTKLSRELATLKWGGNGTGSKSKN